ncbi:biotin/lipoyl-containing protein [Serpentinicella sp. ANB-PHB4]|uniref:biotin/lipoyl-containing protein n=1 Tax=Serpentinicella sp. ANB-PHB4 TaxID=3074076 RepID=UPI00285521A5|nr:biotin/lipoyl-containing protein [Serpentinicella sp. ANB-PHB4]MDR5659116.1 biotin/lipoyl-containing protein [Serpentinicella sp. ANB-PHB4]
MRKFNVTVNGVTYKVDVEEVVGEDVRSPIAKEEKSETKNIMSEKPSASKSGQGTNVASLEMQRGSTIIESPMPGNVWKILVKEGETVKVGQVLVILEAMKMENEITSPKDGVVATVDVKEGIAVGGGDLLVTLK